MREFTLGMVEHKNYNVCLTFAAIEHHWHNGCDIHVTVRKLATPALPAEQVYVEMMEQRSIPDLSVLLHGKHRDKILKSGDKLVLQHYGKDVFFTVLKIQSFEGRFKRI